MATWYAQNSSVNIDSVNEWNAAAGGGGAWLTWPPASGDILAANGKTAIAINVDFNIGTGRLSTAAEGGTAGGGFTTSGARTITCNVQGGTTTCIVVTTGAFVCNGTATGGSATNCRGIDCQTAGVSMTVTAAVGGTASGAYGVYSGGSGNILVITTCTGGTTAAGAYGNCTGAGSSTITTAQGASGNYGFYAYGGVNNITNSLGGVATSSVGSIHVVGTGTITNATGGSGLNTHGVWAYQASALTIGTAKGGSHASALGVFVGSAGLASTVTINAIDTTGTGYAWGSGGGKVKLAAGVNGQSHDASNNLQDLYSPDNMASEDDVRDGTSYGSGDFTGNMVLPAIGDVAPTVQYGTSGTEFEGDGSTCDYPTTGNVLTGVSYANALYGGAYDVVSADDVRDGTPFGAGGGESGNMTLPAEADVEVGVQYGTDGIEYTGTYAPAGGGSAWLSGE